MTGASVQDRRRQSRCSFDPRPVRTRPRCVLWRLVWDPPLLCSLDMVVLKDSYHIVTLRKQRQVVDRRLSST